MRTASNPDPLLDDTRTNDNELHQMVWNNFKIDYLWEMDIIRALKERLEHKINFTLLALLPNTINGTSQGQQHLAKEMNMTNKQYLH